MPVSGFILVGPTASNLSPGLQNSHPAAHHCPQADVYERVIDDVIENMRATFREEGVDESVLVDLQNLWSEKLHQQGTVVRSG